MWKIANKIKDIINKPAKCKWVFEDPDLCYYETSCNNSFMFEEGKIKENQFKYCPFCGKEIIENE